MVHIRLDLAIRCCFLAILAVKGQEFCFCQFEELTQIRATLGGNTTVSCPLEVNGTSKILDWNFCRYNCGSIHTKWDWLARSDGQGNTHVKNRLKHDLTSDGQLKIFNAQPTDQGIYMATVEKIKGYTSPDFYSAILCVSKADTTQTPLKPTTNPTQQQQTSVENKDNASDSTLGPKTLPADKKEKPHIENNSEPPTSTIAISKVIWIAFIVFAIGLAIGVLFGPVIKMATKRVWRIICGCRSRGSVVHLHDQGEALAMISSDVQPSGEALVMTPLDARHSLAPNSVKEGREVLSDTMEHPGLLYSLE